MNGLSVPDPDGGRPCLIGFHEDRDPGRVRWPCRSSEADSVKREREGEE